MKLSRVTRWRRYAVLLVIIVLAGIVFPSVLKAESDETSSLIMRGFNYPSWWHDQYLQPASGQNLGEIAGTGANWVAIVPTQYMQTAQDNSIQPEYGGRTASDEAVARAIDDAHARGLKVMVKPHVDVDDGSSRVEISPRDHAEWFASYESMITGYARIAQDHQAELFSVGTELASLDRDDDYDQWSWIIGAVRADYSGPLTYAASINDFASVSFFDQLDYLGVDFFYPLSDADQPSTEDLIRGWTDYSGSYGAADWLGRIENWHSRWNKPVIFTEIGYRSIVGAARSPWDCSAAPYDGANQARAYDAAFRALRDKPWLAGLFWWNWSAGAGGAGDTGDTDYTVRGKPAESILTSWYTYGRGPDPSLNYRVGSTGWENYADYSARQLTVDFTIDNAGAGTSLNTEITRNPLTGGVTLATPLPLALGDLDAGAASDFRLRYHVPAGVISFRAALYARMISGDGQMAESRMTPWADQAFSLGKDDIKG